MRQKRIRNLQSYTRNDEGAWEESLYAMTEPVDASKVDFKVKRRDTYLMEDVKFEFDALVEWIASKGRKVIAWVHYILVARKGVIFDFNSTPLGIGSYDRHMMGPLPHDILHYDHIWGLTLKHANEIYAQFLEMSGKLTQSGKEPLGHRIWRNVKTIGVGTILGKLAWWRNGRRRDKDGWLASKGMDRGAQFMATYNEKTLARCWPNLIDIEGPQLA